MSADRPGAVDEPAEQCAQHQRVGSVLCGAWLQVNEGSALTAGALIAGLDLDDPTKVKRAETFTGESVSCRSLAVAVLLHFGAFCAN